MLRTVNKGMVVGRTATPLLAREPKTTVGSSCSLFRHTVARAQQSWHRIFVNYSEVVATINQKDQGNPHDRDSTKVLRVP